MEEISKKDLLILTGISYGQLYRWKRKGLIPEDWFIKKASFTGQETYFPKDLILERIDKILEFKDDYSLEELSDIIHNKANFKEISLHTLVKNQLFIHPIVSEMINKDVISFEEVFALKMIDNIYSDIDDKVQIDKFYQYLIENSKEIINEYKRLYCIIKNNQIISILLKEDDNLDYNVSENVLKINITSLLDNIKLIIMA